MLTSAGKLLYEIRLPHQGRDGNGIGVPAAPSIGDLDGDGSLEIVLTTFDHGIDVFHVPAAGTNCLPVADGTRQPRAERNGTGNHLVGHPNTIVVGCVGTVFFALLVRARRRAGVRAPRLGTTGGRKRHRAASLGGSKQRALLALLLLNANRVVSQTAKTTCAHTKQPEVNAWRFVAAESAAARPRADRSAALA